MTPRPIAPTPPQNRPPSPAFRGPTPRRAFLSVAAAALLLGGGCDLSRISSSQPTMHPPLEHHVIYFPECRLHFDLPADLRLSRDLLEQRLLTAVEYDEIRWLNPNASASIVALSADLPTGRKQESLATVSVTMWLCAAPAGFTGDVSLTDDLKRANAELDRADRIEPRQLVETEINEHTWLYRDKAGAYLIGLNRTIYLCARVSVAGGREDPAVREQVAGLRDLILGSMRLERTLIAATTAAHLP